MSEEQEKIRHSILLPWPVEKLMTWCGERLDSKKVGNDLIACVPDEVTCKQCIRAMKEVKVALDTWVPGLPDGCEKPEGLHVFSIEEKE